MNYDLPPLKPLHPEPVLIASKLIVFGRQSTDRILPSLITRARNAVSRWDILEGNHRIDGLRKRGVDVDKLPPESVTKTEL